MTVNPVHPRIWMTPDHLAWLRSPEAQDRPQWQQLLAIARTYRGSNSKYNNHALNNALVWLVTQNPDYASEAIRYVEEALLSKGMPALTGQKNLYEARFLLPEVAVCYDWCYDQLTPEQRQTWGDQLEAWANAVWPDTNPDRIGDWAVANPGDNFFHGFMMTALVGYALYGDRPSGQFHIDLAREKWRTLLRPYLEQFGGYFSLEGTNYGDWTRIMQYLLAHSTATDENDLADPSFLFPQETMLGRLHLTAPTADRLAPFGEQKLDKRALVSQYQRTTPLILLAHGDPETAGIARAWLDWTEPFTPNWRWTTWEAALWYRDDVPAADLAALPTSLVDTRTGFVSVRTSWERDATWLVSNCGPQKESHQDKGANQFYLYREGWLTAPARIWGGNGLLMDTQYLNGILVDGAGQTGPHDLLPVERARIEHGKISGGHADIQGQAARAYDWWDRVKRRIVPRLHDWTRRLLFVQPDLLLVMDTIRPVDPVWPITWVMQCEQEPIINGHQYTIKGETHDLNGRLLQPGYATLRAVPVLKGPAGALSSWQIEITIPGSNTEVSVINLLEIKQR